MLRPRTRSVKERRVPKKGLLTTARVHGNDAPVLLQRDLRFFTWATVPWGTGISGPF